MSTPKTRHSLLTELASWLAELWREFVELTGMPLQLSQRLHVCYKSVKAGLRAGVEAFSRDV